MLSFSPEKLLLVGIIALMVLGPDRLPRAARTLGRLLAEVRRFNASVQSEVSTALAEPREALQEAMGDLGIDDLRASITREIADAFDGPATSAVPATAPSSPAETTPLGGALAPVDGAWLAAPSPAGPVVPDDPALN